MKKPLVMHVAQDGADFYVYDGPYGDEQRLLMTRTYPHPVADFDMAAATRARRWFIELCDLETRRTMIWLGA